MSVPFFRSRNVVYAEAKGEEQMITYERCCLIVLLSTRLFVYLSASFYRGNQLSISECSFHP